MNYWNEVMQDDCYLIAADGWKAEPYRILVKNKAGADVDKGWDCDLVPKALVIDRYFDKEKTTIEKLEARREDITSQLTELEEEHSSEDGYFADMEKMNKAAVAKRLKDIKGNKTKENFVKGNFLVAAEPEVTCGEAAVLEQYLKLFGDQVDLNKKIRDAVTDLDKKALKHYKTLTEADIKRLVVDDKWMNNIERSVKTELERISQRLAQRIKELAERYETPLPKQTSEVADLEAKVNAHLEKMGFVWN
jgi:type I restriction enzyme M protein